MLKWDTKLLEINVGRGDETDDIGVEMGKEALRNRK